MSNIASKDQIRQYIGFAIQGVQEYSQKDINDYYANRNKWIELQANKIEALITQARADERKAIQALVAEEVLKAKQSFAQTILNEYANEYQKHLQKPAANTPYTIFHKIINEKIKP